MTRNANNACTNVSQMKITSMTLCRQPLLESRG